MFCFSDATGEMLAALLRPGKAGANTVAAHMSGHRHPIGQLFDEEARPPICFDQSGWTTRLFSKLSLAAFHIVSYYKGGVLEEPR